MKKIVSLFVLAAITVSILWWPHQKKEKVEPIQIAATNKAIQLLPTNSMGTDNKASPIIVKTEQAALETGERDIDAKYRQGLINKGQAMQETLLLENKKSRDFYGKVIDQDGNPLPGVSVVGGLVLNDGTYGGVQTQKYNTTTDSGGLFEFTGLHGAGLGIIIDKPGYENEWKNYVYQNPNGEQSSPTDRVIYKMWSTNIHEKLITGNKSFPIVPDGRPYFINLTDGTISEQEGGDLKVWIQYTNQVIQGQLADWSAGMEVLHGGLFEATQKPMDSGFSDAFTIPMYIAPADGYVSAFSHKGQLKGGQRGEIGNRYFYLLLKDGKEYGRMGINLFAPYNRLYSGMVCITYAINQSGSRILR